MGYSVTVNASTLIFISERVAAQEGKSGFISLVELISCLRCANMHAFTL